MNETRQKFSGEPLLPARIPIAFLMIVLAVFVLGLTGVPVWAQTPTEAQVTYASAEQIYIAAGSDDGIAAGDTVRVVRDGETIASAVVAFVAASSSACNVIGDTEVVVGDTAIYLRPEAMGEAPEVDAPVAGTPATATPSPRRARDRDSGPPVNELDGRVSVQARLQTDDESGHDVVEPGASLRLRVRNLWGSSHSLQVRARTRRTLRDREVGTDLIDQWDNRVYEIALIYDDPTARLGYRAGRIYANNIRGVGAFDGAMASYAVAEQWELGAFAGLPPDPTTSRVNPDDLKTGAYLHHERGDWSSQRIDATVALAGSYTGGKIDEEYVYQQLRWSWGRTVTLYESAEIGLNRGWRQDATGETVSLDNAVLNARWSPVDDWSFDVGYDNRRILRTWETRDTPDSLFDDSVREGWRLGTSARLTRDVRFSAQANVRTREGEDGTVTGHVRLGDRDLFEMGVSGDLRLAVYDSPTSTGFQPSLTLAFYPVARLRASVEGGTRTYDYSRGDLGTLTDVWVRPSLSATFSGNLYGSAYGEFTRGDRQSTNRFFVELGLRL